MSADRTFGGCIVSNNIINKKGVLKWCIREQPVNAADNGWRFLSSMDTEAFLQDPANMSAWSFSTVIEIEPAILSIYGMPIGSELTLVREGKRKFFVYTETGERVE